MVLKELIEKLEKVREKYGDNLEIEMEHEGFEGNDYDDVMYRGYIEMVYFDGVDVCLIDRKDRNWGYGKHDEIF